MDLDFFDSQNDFMESELEDNDIKYHIRIKQRNGRKCITYVENLEQLNSKNDTKFLDNILRTFKKKFSCNGSIDVEKDDDNNIVKQTIELQGDHRDAVKELLIKQFKAKDDSIKIHGF